MTILHFLAGPVIGGVIGYFTNYIAVKMLFHPRNPVKIGKYTLPFTPGIIPKRKNLLARAIGETVAEKVFTKEDIKEIFLSEKMKKTVAESVWQVIYGKEGEQTASELALSIMTDEELDDMKAQMEKTACEKIYGAICRTNIASLVAVECEKVLQAKARGTVLGKVLNESRISSISGYVGTSMEAYIRDEGEYLILPVLSKEIDELLEQPGSVWLEEIDESEERMQEFIKKIYEKFMEDYSPKVVEIFDIAALTEKKIIEFDAEDVEKLVYTTIRKEMQAVVNLGGVLGVIIGFVNTFINSIGS